MNRSTLALLAAALAFTPPLGLAAPKKPGPKPPVATPRAGGGFVGAEEAVVAGAPDGGQQHKARLAHGPAEGEVGHGTEEEHGREEQPEGAPGGTGNGGAHGRKVTTPPGPGKA